MRVQACVNSALQLAVCLCLSSCVVHAVHGGDSVSSVADLGYSKYQGTSLSCGVNQFLGMRYAAPPLGQLRWRAPQDPIEVPGIQSADQFSPICVGLGERVDANKTEDCLFVNVWAPSKVTTSSNLPVWVYIQGGGFVTNANANYNGTKLVLESDHSIVLVNFNYRVGPLGFLTSEEIRHNGDLNVGLLDQRQLLRWVQKYIHLFGGDPSHVVIHGASAGAVSVTHHLTAYGGRDEGLFVGAIGESIAWTPSLTVAESEANFQSLASQLSCSGSNVVDCLRLLDATAIQTLGGAPNDYLVSLQAKLLFQPAIDGEIFPDAHYNSFYRGEFIHVPLIVGDDTNEGSLFAANASTTDEVADFVRTWSAKLSNSQVQDIVGAYPPTESVPGRAEYFSSASNIFAEGIFLCPTAWVAGTTSDYSREKVWNYRYNVLDDIAIAAGLGVPHTFETEAIFGPGQAESIRPGFAGAGASYSTYNAAIVPVIQNYLISFVKSLDPNTCRSAISPVWKPFNKGSNVRIKLQTKRTAMEPIPHDLRERCKLWYSFEDGVTSGEE
ncbi:Alpha/Beta hydrolase protein [Aspergillus pseudoustus]|uniref:Carboxylic ester hydrolase n=1 Tax=Aspergillus pseudoustus TaxID=1810923 RepID=A0ABR4KI15_9EURO